MLSIEPTECPHCNQWVWCTCRSCHQSCLQPEEYNSDYDVIDGRLFGNYSIMKQEGFDFLRSGDENETLYLVTATPYDDKYDKDPMWYRSKNAYRTVGRMVKSGKYLMTREYLECNKAHIHALVYSKEDLVKSLHDKSKYKYHYDVQEVDYPDRAMRYIIKWSKFYTFDNGDDYIVQYPLKAGYETTLAAK